LILEKGSILLSTRRTPCKVYSSSSSVNVKHLSLHHEPIMTTERTAAFPVLPKKD
jgi:hypothetical protein